MSQSHNEASNVLPNEGFDNPHPPWSAPNEASLGESNFVESSEPIFSMYLEMAEEEDKKIAESWKADAEGMLVFTGLFSAAVASLISVSIQDVQQNPQDTSNFYLANIYQLALADPNQSNISSSLPVSPPPFSPPNHAIWVNSLWFSSLLISLSCALLATLLQQWARRYLKVTQTRSSLHKRARTRSFFAEGVEKSPLPLMVEALPTLIHVSLFLFFAGLVVFIWNVNLTIFKVVLSCVCACIALYGCITLVPIFRHDSPYYTPLTPLVRLVVIVILHLSLLLYVCFYMLVWLCFCGTACFGLFRIFTYVLHRLKKVKDLSLMTPKKAALEVSSEIDTRALMWTFDRLDEDHELERFFSGLTGFHGSNMVKERLRSLNDRQRLRLLEAVIRLLDRTFSSNLLTDQVKSHRADICSKAIDLVDAPNVFPEIVTRLACEKGYGPVRSTQTVDFVRGWGKRKGEDITSVLKSLFSVVVARTHQHLEQHGNSWFTLASDELGIPEPVLQSHAAHGDRLSLAMLIHITRQQFLHIRRSSWPSDAISNVLQEASKFNVQDTSPELQHEFCALWNEMVRDARKGSSEIPEYVLRPIRHIYLSLHQGTDSAPTRFFPSTGDHDISLFMTPSYPVCNVAGHNHNDFASTTVASTVPHNNALFPASPASPVTSSFPLPSPFHNDESPTTVPPLDGPRPLHQTNKILHTPVTSPDRATTGAMRDAVTPGITTSHPIPLPELPTPKLVILHPPSISLRHHTDPQTPSDSPNLSSSTFIPVLDDVLSTESHRSVMVTSASPGPASAPNLDAAAGDNVNRAIHANTMNSPLDPRSASQPSITDSDVDIAGGPIPEPNPGRTRDPHDSRYEYDMV